MSNSDDKIVALDIQEINLDAASDQSESRLALTQSWVCLQVLVLGIGLNFL